MEKELRDYQAHAIDKLVEAVKEGERSVYIKCGTGGGKTFVAKSIIDKIRNDVQEEVKFLFVVPKNILIKQTIKEFGEGGIYNATLGERDLSQSITVGSIQSLVGERSLPKFNVVFFDEVHRARRQHEQLLAKIRVENPRALVIGLTATDYVLNEKLNLKKICDFSLKYLTEKGYLAPLVVLPGHEKLDISKMRAQGDSYRQRDIDEQLDEKVEKQVADMLLNTKNRNKVIVMCTTIEHAERVAHLTGDCQLYHSRLGQCERDYNLEEWKNEGKYLISVIAASEGFDYPPADCLVLFRPTRSPTLYEQACGRIARLHPSKKNGLILDYGGVIDSLGLPYEIEVKKKGVKDYKECKDCGAANSPNSTHCDACGQAFTYACKGCGKIRVFGSKCCERQVDRYKNLTERAYTEAEKFKPLSKITLHKHISRKGNECLKVVWWRNDFDALATEYFMFLNQEFRQFSQAIFKETPDNPLDLLGKTPINIPKEVYVKKIEGYQKVTSLRFF